MAQDETLNRRIRDILQEENAIEERNMFGGRCFLFCGNMICGADAKNGLMVRVGPDQYESALKHKHARVMDFTGRPMKGFVFVNAQGYASKAQLKRWIEMGMDYARSLPIKKAKKKSPRRSRQSHQLGNK